jgi:hypothetical protein
MKVTWYRGGSIFRRSFIIFAAAAFLPIAAMALQGYHCARKAILDDRLHIDQYFI